MNLKTKLLAIWFIGGQFAFLGIVVWQTGRMLKGTF